MLRHRSHWLLVPVALAALTACGGDGGTATNDTVADTATSDDVDTGVGDSGVGDTGDDADTTEADTAGVDTAEADTAEADTAEADTAEADTTPVCTDGTLGCPCRDSGDACDDGLACATDATCVTAACTEASCDDGNACTSDSCDPLVGCSHTNLTGSCDDGDACTVGDTCVDGACAAGATTRDCDDGIDCTADTCEAAIGCIHAPDDGQCDDDVDCTVDACVIGTGCVNTVDDSACDNCNPCTTDTCSATKGCRFTGVDNYTSCEGDAECIEARDCLDLGRGASTCATLGWDDLYGSGEICSASYVADTDDGCSGLVTFPEAARICAAAGGRLCTADELDADEARGTGCSYDAQAIWSSTACDGGYTYAAGSTVYASAGRSGCSAPTDTHYVRCCSDVVQLAPTAPLCLLVTPPAEAETCTASNPADPCKPTGLCDVYGACIDQPDPGASCTASNPDDPCKPTALCDAAGTCVDQVAAGAECPATDPTNSCAAEGECDAAGLCQDVVLDDGELCVDGDDQTTYDACFAGLCVGCSGDAADPGDDALEGATVVSGDGALVEAALCPGDVDYFAVDVPEKGTLLVNVGEGIGDIWRSCPADIDADVLDPDGAQRASNDDYALGSCPSLGPEEVIDNQLHFMDLWDLAEGTYYVRTYGHDATVGAESYTVRIAAAAPGPKKLGVSSSQASPYDVTWPWYWSALNSNSDEEWYRIPVTADAPSLDVTVGYSISWGYRATLYDSAGTQILYVDDSSFNYADAARIIGPKVNGLAAGDYLLKVTREGNIYGAPYLMRIQHGSWTTGDEVEPNDTVDQATPVPDGANSMSATLTSGDVDWYTFTVTEKATLVITTGIESIAADTFLELYDETGTTQNGGNTDGGIGRTSKLRKTFEPGTYTLKVSEDATGDGGLGAYTLFLVGR